MSFIERLHTNCKMLRIIVSSTVDVKHADKSEKLTNLNTYQLKQMDAGDIVLQFFNVLYQKTS